MTIFDDDPLTLDPEPLGPDALTRVTAPDGATILLADQLLQSVQAVADWMLAATPAMGPGPALAAATDIIRSHGSTHRPTQSELAAAYTYTHDQLRKTREALLGLAATDSRRANRAQRVARAEADVKVLAALATSLPPLGVQIGDVVRRGKGKTLWRIASIDAHFISLESVTQSWTKQSVTLDKAHTLTVVTTAVRDNNDDSSKVGT